MAIPPDASPPPPPPRKGTGRAPPSPELVAAYRGAFDHFNRALFRGELPEVLLSFSRSESTSHELNLNPEHLVDKSPREVAAAVVHEMCHVWRLLQGNPPRRAYHDRTWAEKMLAFGLTPRASDGRMTGVTVHTLINDVGAFVDAYATLPDADVLRWPSGGDGARKRVAESKVKFTCGCSNAWGKPGLSMKCLRCGNTFAVADDA